MHKDTRINPPLLGAVSTLALGLSICVNANSSENPFEIKDLRNGYRIAQATTDVAMPEGKCGEGKCGAGMMDAKTMPEGKCGEGKCGAGMMDAKAMPEGKCGEGMCGADMMGKMPEGACGNMTLDMEGMVMNANTDNLPKNCTEISEDVEFTVRASTEFANKFSGTIWGFDKNEWKVKPCSRITVRFINDDGVRHQWMVHNLPSYLYPAGMFHLEANGGFEKTGTFIVPKNSKTYLVHCDIAQHMEKGLKGQLVVGGGDKNLSSIPGLSSPRFADQY